MPRGCVRIQTWNGKPLSPGEIVILHWVPGLGQPAQHSLDGD